MKNKFILILLFCSIFGNQAFSQNSAEYYQALFIVKFLKYANWTKPTERYTIGVVGNSTILPHLTTLTKDKDINGKPVSLIKVSTHTNLEQYSLLYIPKSQNNKFDYIVSLTKNMNILIVCEDQRHINKGASICFFEAENNLKFKINTTTLEKQKIQLNSRLTSVGVIVK